MIQQHVGRLRCAALRAVVVSLIFCGGLLAPLYATSPLGPSQTIVFDDVVGPGNPTTSGVQVGPWLFASLQFHTVTGYDSGLVDFVDNGTPFIASVGGGIDYPITLERADGRPFALVGFDVAEGFLDDIAAAEEGYVSATAVELEAMLSSGFTVALEFALDGLRDGPDGVDDFESFANIDELRSVTSVTFTGLAGTRRDAGFALDNVVVAAVVPEPASATLALAAVAAAATIAFVRRRRSPPGIR
jgi:hypothetical protein